MTVREHDAQHDDVQTPPAISKAATVTEVTAMDRDRDGEIRETLHERGAEWIRGRGSRTWRCPPAD